ncbi:hypothetical protein FGG08_000127 [Glutinoglossum americanum]|uniref:MATE efflux family protein n=1 Tax=Glutinoglossum americanum TaxID=1670608 RepID=A0A9P8L684_9PEZI|nr:hypothetical protein FGG08_000127 [Glutinoglossum americanum]
MTIGSPYSSSPIAAASLARDLNEYPFYGQSDDSESEAEPSIARQAPGLPDVSMVGSYRRPSITAIGPRPTLLPAVRLPEGSRLPKGGWQAAKEDERSLLRDNHVLPSKPSGPGGLTRLFSHVRAAEEEPAAIAAPTETSALLGREISGSDDNIAKRWEEAVLAGLIQTTWQREAKTLGRYSRSLIVTFLLQYSLTVASIFTVGHLGKIPLGAVSLASMTSNITGYAIYHGLATSLDTLCAQAYGSGRKKLVGLQLQRMVYFLWLVTIPIGVVWLSAGAILRRVVPDPELGDLAGRYLRILLIGAPGYACFESGKRYLQAQGMFNATLHVLLFCAPLNALMNWLLVWAHRAYSFAQRGCNIQKFGWGFIGAPIAVAIADTILPLCLFLYVRFVNGMQCWDGFTYRAFSNWGPMIRLALPGLLMVEAEFLAFEILTLASSYLSTTHLAAQSILGTISSITFQIPFPISIAASTRIANLIGATLSGAAKTSAKVALVAAAIVGLLNMILLSSLRKFIPQLFTNDPDVIEMVAKVLPLCAAFQLFDALAANCNGILRGLGRQEIGGWVNLFFYYVVSSIKLPVELRGSKG